MKRRTARLISPALHSAQPEQPLRIGVSSCLLGNSVRYDGGHKHDRFLTDIVGNFVEWVPVCPEVELGLGVPRPTIRLEGDQHSVRLVEPASGVDHTRAMQRYAEARVELLSSLGLSGFVVKKGSPSCGMERVRVHRQRDADTDSAPASAAPTRSGRGLFTAALMRRLPLLPVEEEGRLQDLRLRENFLERVFAYQRLRQLFDAPWKLRDLIAFHTAHKLQLMAHAPAGYQQLGRLVAEAKQQTPTRLRAAYETEFMKTLAVLAAPRRQVNVLQHMLGYFSSQLDGGELLELQTLIADYRQHLVPLIAPLILIRHYVRRFDVTYLQGQTYLEPHPKELMLRNHV